MKTKREKGQALLRSPLKHWGATEGQVMAEYVIAAAILVIAIAGVLIVFREGLAVVFNKVAGHRCGMYP
ncbi:MAG: hypothetical protein ABII64_01700 [Elusimicrobiota bacterium]